MGSLTSRLAGAALEGALIALIILALIAVPVLAGKGNGGSGGGGRASSGGGTMTERMLDGSDNVPNYGERMTFDVQTSATDRPFVSLKCWQGTTGVYNKSIGVFPSYLFDPWFNLYSQYWTAGVEAQCTARLYHYNKRGNQVTLATKELVVQP